MIDIITFASIVIGVVVLGIGVLSMRKKEKTLTWFNPKGYIQLELEKKGVVASSVMKSSKKECPFGEEFISNQGQVYTFYKINYEIEEKKKDGWAIKVTYPSSVNAILSSRTEWIWRLT